MQSIYFTLCSNNYLSYAVTLAESLRQTGSGIKLIVGLVDKLDNSIRYSEFEGIEIIPCFDLEYRVFEEMLVRYNIIEFNTAVKPFYFEYLFGRYPEVDRIYYIDPDIFFYVNPSILESEWGDATVLLTPNLIYLPSKTVRGELASLRHGLNNLGFMGISRSEEGNKLISWWKERLILHCRIDKCNGIFVDQKWMDIALLYFSGIKLVPHPGWNMAWWNLSERILIREKDTLFVNSTEFPLVFFHFSGFKPGMDSMTERLKSEEFDMEQMGPLRDLFDEYSTRLLANKFTELSKINPQLKFQVPPNELKHRIGRVMKSKMTNLIYRIFSV